MEETSTNAEVKKSSAKDRVIIRGKSHMPDDSVLFERVIPVLLAILGLVTLVFILFAAGVLLGIVPF
jgi:hypothetical protein